MPRVYQYVVKADEMVGAQEKVTNLNVLRAANSHHLHDSHNLHGKVPKVHVFLTYFLQLGEINTFIYWIFIHLFPFFS